VDTGLLLGIRNCGGGYRQTSGSLNMRKVQIYIKKQNKTEKITPGRGVVFQLEGSLPPRARGGCKNMTA